jgi:hypothetical protein
MHCLLLLHLFHKDAIGEDTQTLTPTPTHTSSHQVHTYHGNQRPGNHCNQPQPTTTSYEKPRKGSAKTKRLKKETKHHHGYGRRTVGGHKEGRTRERATKNLTTGRKDRRRPSTHTRTITREKTEELPQAKYFFFILFYIEFFIFQIDRNFFTTETHTNWATRFQWMNAVYGVKKQYRKENTKHPWYKALQSHHKQVQNWLESNPSASKSCFPEVGHSG